MWSLCYKGRCGVQIPWRARTWLTSRMTPGMSIPDWPKLLHLYSRMRPGKTVFEWMQDHDVRSLGIDVRRFASFGVIKVRKPFSPHEKKKRKEKKEKRGRVSHSGTQGFLRRVHRWPMLLTDDFQQSLESKPTATLPPSPVSRKRAISLTVTSPASSNARPRRRTSEAVPAFAAAALSAHSPIGTVSPPSRAAEASLGTLRSRAAPTPPPPPPPTSPPTIRVRDPRRHSMAMSASLFEIAQALAAPVAEPRLQHAVRPRPSRSPSSPAVTKATTATTQSNGAAPAPMPVLVSQPLAYPPSLVPLLDGEHHTDELCCRFEVGWPTLERWLVTVGEGSGDGDFGKLLIIYR